MERLLDRIITRTLRQLVNQGALVEDPDQPWLNLEDPDTLDQLSAASVRYRIAIGPETGKRTLTITNPGLARSLAPQRSRPPKPFTVNRDGFSLNAAVSIPAHRRDRLEHLCRQTLSQRESDARQQVLRSKTCERVHHPTRSVPRTLVATPGRSGSVAAKAPVSRWHHALCVYTGRLHRTVGRTRSQTTAQPHPISRGVCTQRSTQSQDHTSREGRIRWATTSPKTTKGTGL